MSLTTNLVSWWSLDQESDGTAPVTRLDSHGDNHLTDNGTTASAAGKVGNAASFVAADSTNLSVASNASLQVGNIDFSVAAWVNLRTLVNSGIFTKDTSFGGGREFDIQYQATAERFRFLVSPDGTTSNSIDSSIGIPTVDTWYFIVAWHDADEDTINIQVNNGTVDSVAHATGVFTGTTPVHIGSFGGPIAFFNGEIDEVAFAKQVWTPAERTFLYNGGAGRSYAEVAPSSGSRRGKLFRP